MPEGNEPKASQVPVGVQLKRRRQTLKLSLGEVEVATKIRGKYLIEIESGDYSKLPNDIYVRGFVFNYAKHLGLDAEEVAQRYMHERGGQIDSAPMSAPQGFQDSRVVITPQLAILGGILLIVGLVVAYLSWQFAALAGAPRLEVLTPAADGVVEASLLEVSGQVDGGADVTINDSPILTDAAGRFRDTLSLQDGVNIISVTARNKLGKSTTVTRNMLAKLPNAEVPTISSPVEGQFEGVMVEVRIKDAATAITAVVDGRETKQTVLAGATQVFRGKGEIRIKTANAAQTILFVTNSRTSRKELDNLGPNKEAREFTFAPDTVVQ